MNGEKPANAATPESLNGAQVLVRTLEDAGVECVFGYPGGTIMPVYDALYDSHLQHILCRHEQGARRWQQDGYARASGKLGVCIATSGPGATNLVTGIANAYMDSVPVLAITGQVATAFMGTDAFQEVDIFGVTMPIVKHSYISRDPDNAAGNTAGGHANRKQRPSRSRVAGPAQGHCKHRHALPRRCTGAGGAGLHPL